MIIGSDIITRKLIKHGKTENLKNSSLNLKIGQIIPVDPSELDERLKHGGPERYFLQPREMVWIISQEQFSMPKDVTGLAVLRTRLTSQGILALNTGIIDPFYDGPISTALINFSDRPREIGLGQDFMRILFFEHDDASDYRRKDAHGRIVHDTREVGDYIRQTEAISRTEFSKNFLNVEEFNDEFLSGLLQKMAWSWIKKNPIKVIVTISAIILLFHLYLVSVFGSSGVEQATSWACKVTFSLFCPG